MKSLSCELTGLDLNILMKKEVYEQTPVNEIYYLRKVKVNIGCVSEGFSEIINGGALMKVVTKGVYNLHAE